jgi:hypothetical protein
MKCGIRGTPHRFAVSGQVKDLSTLLGDHMILGKIGV